MESQQYIEASLYMASDVIILCLAIKYYRVFGRAVSVMLSSYALFSFVFYLGLLGVPIASGLFVTLLDMRLDESGKMVPTLLASVVGIVNALLKVGLAISVLLLGKKIAANTGR